MADLQGRTALITGASRGIGSAIARSLHGAGAEIIISGSQKETLEEFAATLGNQRVHILPADLSQRDSVDDLLKGLGSHSLNVDVLVNNAGITRDNLAVRIKDSDWDDVLEVNLTSAYRITRGLLRGMMKKRWGRIINITSIVGTTGNPGQINYCAAKAGMTGMTKSLAQEVASRGITVNCVAPGFIDTAMTSNLTEDQKSRINTNIPMGRMGSSDDVATAVKFLVSDDSAYITGQTLHVNGGLVMV